MGQLAQSVAAGKNLTGRKATLDQFGKPLGKTNKKTEQGFKTAFSLLTPQGSKKAKQSIVAGRGGIADRGSFQSTARSRKLGGG